MLIRCVSSFSFLIAASISLLAAAAFAGSEASRAAFATSLQSAW